MTRRSPTAPAAAPKRPDRASPNVPALSPTELDQVTAGDGSGAPVRNPPQGTFNFRL